MFALLPTVLQDIILQYAYDATLSQTNSALDYILFMKEIGLHPCVVRSGCFDYSLACKRKYCRETHMHTGFFSPWNVQQVDTPFRSFYVWWSKRDLYDLPRMTWVIDDMDFRSVRELFRSFPVPCRRDYKLHVKLFVENDPEQAAIFLSPIFREMGNEHLIMNTSNVGRYIVSNYCPRIVDWKSFPVIFN
jgi:hypothetical protein